MATRGFPVGALTSLAACGLTIVPAVSSPAISPTPMVREYDEMKLS
jgi:hypothetical protein